MSVNGLLLCRSNAPVANAQHLFIYHAFNASELKSKSTGHYDAVANTNKGLEAHVCLCECSVPGERYKAAMDLEDSEYFSPHDAEIAKSDRNPNHQSSATSEDVPTSEVTSQQSERGTTYMSWSDLILDTVDRKNAPDYDPDQEESEYDSTPPPEPIPSTSPVEPPCVQRYVKLQSKPENSIAGTTALAPRHLLLLFIPGPINDPTPVSSPGSGYSESAVPRRHKNFLFHYCRYPYLTSHDNFIKHTAYVLDSDASDAHPQYLIVQEFSELEISRGGRRIGVDWELKRKEAKHWWGKEERGASGIKVGFYRLREDQGRG